MTHQSNWFESSVRTTTLFFSSCAQTTSQVSRCKQAGQQLRADASCDDYSQTATHHGGPGVAVAIREIERDGGVLAALDRCREVGEGNELGGCRTSKART